jgi:pimeloyl-ACP methyl ester carboxylesterase
LIAETHPEKFALASLLHTDKFPKAAKVVMAAPYRPNRIPIILIHGLAGSPVAWVPMINGLNASPEIREKYQIWLFRYPSGLPYTLSAALFRRLGSFIKNTRWHSYVHRSPEDIAEAERILVSP